MKRVVKNNVGSRKWKEIGRFCSVCLCACCCVVVVVWVYMLRTNVVLRFCGGGRFKNPSNCWFLCCCCCYCCPIYWPVYVFSNNLFLFGFLFFPFIFPFHRIQSWNYFVSFFLLHFDKNSCKIKKDKKKKTQKIIKIEKTRRKMS